MDALVLASPDAAIAAVPHLLGFTPERSWVLAWSRDERLVLTQRMDIEDEPSVPWMQEAVRHGVRLAAEAVVAIVYCPRGAGPELPGRATVDALERRLAIHGIELLDALIVDESLWWSYRCNEACCPPEGRCLDGGVADVVSAGFVMQGSAPFISREALEDTMRGEPEDALTPIPRSDDVALEAWRDAVLGGPASRLLDGGEFSSVDASILIGGLVDTRIRDTLLWRITAASSPREVIGALTEVLRRTPDACVPPVATVLAITAWICGDGARASMAVARALLQEPEYPLAVLVDGSLRAGLAPTAWVASMRGLTERECRNGPYG